MFAAFWTPDRRLELVTLMDANPRTYTDFEIAKHFKKSRRECYTVYNAVKREAAIGKIIYVDENGLTVVRYKQAYAQGVAAQVSARAKETV